MPVTLSDAPTLAEHFVAPLGRRWWHVQAVAARAERIATAVPTRERELLIAVAWLHDIGYSSEIGHTGFHPLDGARYLRERGWPGRLVDLVAHHSGARFEAEERGLGDELAEFRFKASALQDALDTADLTTGPGGESVSYDQRLSEILIRYPSSHPVHRAWLECRPVLEESVHRTEARCNG